MKLFIKYDVYAACKKILEEQLDKLGLTYQLTGFSEIDIKNIIPADVLTQLSKELNRYGIAIVENQKSILVQKIKDAIVEMVYLDDELPVAKTSAYLSAKLHHSYGHLSNVFSEVTYTSIENFIIMQKVERAKQLMTTTDLTFTEISYKLNYSSMAHLSAQFKHTTGLTPTAFQRIINKRRGI